MNNILAPHIAKIEKKVNAMSLREKVLLLLTLLATIYYSWEILLYNQITIAHQQIMKKTDATERDIVAFKAQLEALTKAAEGNNIGDELKSRETALKQENLTLEKEIIGVTKQLIPAEDMAKLLADILSQDQDLKVLKLENLPEEPIFYGEENGKESSSQQLGELQVYRHGLVIEISANYFSTQRFLEALEKLPWKFMWEEMEYKVEEYPRATSRIVLYTLSLQKEWLEI